MKKIITLILVIILLLDLSSCHSYTYISTVQDYKAYQDKKHVYAFDLITNKDSMVYFSSSFPGKLANSEVTGPRQVIIQDFAPDSVIYRVIYRNNMKQVKYALKNDIKYIVIYQNDTALVCIASDTTRIPFSDIKQMHLKKLDQGKSALLVSGIAVGLAGIIYLIIINLSFSMPIV
jgi:hypothetical protein